MTCDPRAAGIIPMPTAAAEPLLDPPGVRVGSQGLRVRDGCDEANSVVTVPEHHRTGFAQRRHCSAVAFAMPADK